MFIQIFNRQILFHFARVMIWIIFATLSSTILPCAEPAAATRESLPTVASSLTNPPIREIGPGLYQIGDVRLDRRQRTIQFPAAVNLSEGNIEYVIVSASGKTHESLLRTSVEPFHLQLAFLLLGAKGAGTNTLAEDPSASLPGERVQVELSWVAAGKTNRALAAEFVRDRKTGSQASHDSWVYTGSRLREDGFAAQLDGSIVSLITDPDALVNNPRRGREDDDNWLVHTNNLPPLHSPMDVTIRLGK